jgi:hypothetical protein
MLLALLAGCGDEVSSTIDEDGNRIDAQAKIDECREGLAATPCNEQTPAACEAIHW